MRHFDQSFKPDMDASDLRFAVVAARYNAGITDALLEGALAALREAGAKGKAIEVVRVPGAFEIPIAMQHLLDAHDFDAAIALGAVVRGDTPHFDFVANGCMQGLMSVSLDSGVPVAFGVLTTDTMEQAEERARPDGSNKGREAALTAIEMAGLIGELKA